MPPPVYDGDMKTIIACAMSMGLGMALVGGYAAAKEPVQNVSAKKHPNIAAAQKYSVLAFEALEKAQKANEYDLDGHAQKAKEALKVANDEMKLAAEASNKNPK
jgi:hypothetical protein